MSPELKAMKIGATVHLLVGVALGVIFAEALIPLAIIVAVLLIGIWR